MYVCYELPQIYPLTEYNSPKIGVALTTKGIECDAVFKMYGMYSVALSSRHMSDGNFRHPQVAVLHTHSPGRNRTILYTTLLTVPYTYIRLLPILISTANCNLLLVLQGRGRYVNHVVIQANPVIMQVGPPLETEPSGQRSSS
jgi:hypothetical protein